MNQQMIVQVGWLIGRSVGEIEAEYGQATTVAPVAVGAAEELPAGGEGRSYLAGNYILLVNFDQAGIAQGAQVTDGLATDGYKLEQWPVVLNRMGMMVTKEPNAKLPLALKWFNFNGYDIYIFAERRGGPVWSVRVFRTRVRSWWQKLVGR